MAYWDTSCLLKLYVTEPESAIFRAHVLSGATLFTSEIARLELFAALHRKEALGHIDPGDARIALSAFDGDATSGLVSVLAKDSRVISAFESIVERCHHRSPPLLLRTLDGIHLATAVVSGEAEIVAADKRLRDAALVIGLAVFPTP